MAWKPWFSGLEAWRPRSLGFQLSGLKDWRSQFSASLPAGNFIIGWGYYLFLGGSKGVPFARSKMSPGKPKTEHF